MQAVSMALVGTHMDPAKEEVWLGSSAQTLNLAVRSTGGMSSAYSAAVVVQRKLWHCQHFQLMISWAGEGHFCVSRV